MQIEKESPNKIKITLNTIDFQEMNFSPDALKPNSPQLHTFLYEIMERVKEETGFNPYLGQIMVEASPSKEGMELTVTRLTNEKKAVTKQTFNKNNVRAVIKKQAPKYFAYYFNSFEDFCKGLLKLSQNTLNNASYYILNDINILLVWDIGEEEKYKLKEYSLAAKKGVLIASYLEEHAKLKANSKELLTMAEGLKKLQSEL